jgi:hypothetical protein
MIANIDNLQRVYNEIPSRYVVNGNTIDGYDKLTENHFADGWREVIIPEISELQRLGDEFILVDDIITKEVINFTDEEIEELNANKILELEKKIIEKYNYLMMRALSSSMQKYGSYEYLNNQRQEYYEKYLVAKGLKISIHLNSSLQKEMNRDFTDASLITTLAYFGLTPEPTKLENFYKLIIFKYEYAENRYEIFKAFCVDYRTKCRTFLELNQIDKLNQAFTMADNLSETITDEEIETLYNEFDAL